MDKNFFEIMDEKIFKIAQKYLLVETLESRNSDRLDFHSIPVWQIKYALQQAYLAGKESK